MCYGTNFLGIGNWELGEETQNFGISHRPNNKQQTTNDKFKN